MVYVCVGDILFLVWIPSASALALASAFISVHYFQTQMMDLEIVELCILIKTIT